MEIKPPTAAELDVILARHAHRFPEKFSLSFPGDRGSTVKIPVLVGNPSGACKLPLGEKPSPAWSHLIAVAFRVREESTELVRQAALDCLLWPDPRAWTQVVDRWPAAPDTLWDTARAKCGAALSLMSFPELGEETPAPIAAALERHPQAVWRKLRAGDRKLHIIVEPPQSIAWSFFSDAMKKDDADRWSLVCELAQTAVPFVARATDATMTEPAKYDELNFTGDVLSRYPGFAMHVALTLGQLAGIAARVDRDGW